MRRSKIQRVAIAIKIGLARLSPYEVRHVHRFHQCQHLDPGIVGGGNFGQSGANTVATPFFQNNESIFNIIYTYNNAPWTITPYFQYTNVPRNPALPYFHDNKPHECSQTWQVIRSEFDTLMLNNAREQGVEVHQPARDNGAAERPGHARCVESEFLGCLKRRVADPVQHLGDRGPHPGALTGGKDDDRRRTLTASVLARAAGPISGGS